ncbi:ATP-binding cassette domain-containing protein [Candidatus Woesearchaeota archaeon]|nr:ATP-binding cassette domain-containing protein [Candidatus Woesearchaeota archaeon]
MNQKEGRSEQHSILPAVSVKNLKKTYLTHKRGEGLLQSLKSFVWREHLEIHALRGINFSIQAGEIIGFIGPNGAGKSTCLKILSGILHPTSGDVTVLGYVPWKSRISYVGHIGAVFGQKSQLWWDLPPIDSFRLMKSIYSIPDAQYEKNLREMVRLLEVPEVIHRPTRSLSLGERMKCEFINAMLHNPAVVFLDEPTIGLDVFAKETIREFILRWNRLRGTTFILTTHDLQDIETLAQRIIVIDHGRIVFDNSLSALKARLGGGKHVRIRCKRPIITPRSRAVTIKNLISREEKEFIVDTQRLGIGEFIKLIGRGNQILDMSIEEPPIQEIIKKVYKRA